MRELSNPINFAKEYEKQFFSTFEKKKKEFNYVKQSTIFKVLTENGKKLRFSELMKRYLYESIVMKNHSLYKGEFLVFDYHLTVSSYVKDGHIIAYDETIDIISEYDSKYKTYDFLISDEEILSERINELELIIKNSKPDRTRNMISYLSKMYVDVNILIDVFSNRHKVELFTGNVRKNNNANDESKNNIKNNDKNNGGNNNGDNNNYPNKISK